MKRRDFSAGLAAGVILAGSGVASAAALSGQQLNIPALQRQALEARLQQQFKATSIASNCGCKLRLESVSDAGEHTDQFFVRFRSDTSNTQLSENIYQLSSTEGSDLVLHLQPSRSDSMMLEAVINQQTA